MMKKMTKTIAASLLLISGLLTSCDLTHEPSDLIPFRESFRTMEDLRKWDNGIYSTLRGKMGGAYVLPQEAQADMLNAHVSSRAYQSFHSWDLKATDETLNGIYQSYYAALTDVNLVLAYADQVEIPKGEEDRAKKMIAQYKGNAYFARAYYYFNLAIRWGMPYVEETAATDLCVPHPLEMKPLELLPRATNKVVWDRILDDLHKAEELLAGTIAVEGNKELSQDLVIALRARVLYYMNRPAEALAAAERLISKRTYPLIAPLKESDPRPNETPIENDPFVQMWQRDSGKEQIWQPFIEKPHELTNAISLYGADLSTQQHQENERKRIEPFNAPNFLPTVEMLALFDSKDRRANAYFEFVYTSVQSPDNIFGYIAVISKFKGNPALRDRDSKVWGGYVPNGIQAPKPFRIAEQYLIAAESAYDTQDEDKAKTFLNDLRLSRGLEATEATGEELQKLIREERARELAFEGFRLWDLRKWGNGFTRGRPQSDSGRNSTDFIQKEYGLGLEIKARHDFFIWGFPGDEVQSINPNLKQNPGWK